MKHQGTRRRPFHIIGANGGPGWQIENIMTGAKAIGGVGYYHGRDDVDAECDRINDRWEAGEGTSNPFADPNS